MWEVLWCLWNPQISLVTGLHGFFFQNEQQCCLLIVNRLLFIVLSFGTLIDLGKNCDCCATEGEQMCKISAETSDAAVLMSSNRGYCAQQRLLFLCARRLSVESGNSGAKLFVSSLFTALPCTWLCCWAVLELRLSAIQQWCFGRVNQGVVQGTSEKRSWWGLLSWMLLKSVFLSLWNISKELS